MKHQIDPKIDCVFKALLGAEDNRNLLVHFLNAILSADLVTPIATVDILNPYNDKEFLEDKLSIVDVKARDNEGNLYQIEIQLVNFTDLPERILYNWADIYSEQLRNGEGYYRLKPTYSIWLLAENLIKADSDYIHTYKLRDTKGRTLNNHCGIWLLELQKFCEPQVVNEQQRWLRFFKEGEQLNDDLGLPDWMTTEEMRQAMSTLKQFSEKDKDYHAYQARQNFLREQLSRQHELDEERQAKNEAIQEKEAALKDKADALAEIERLKVLLAKNNLN
ncbi:MAG: Rpn family recombination-promoting nuclease/putative transposase [Methylococcales bacterium]|nr:Rpn family recombination-promoting nuclease/putative transposase [Methylococcales bacterium]